MLPFITTYAKTYSSTTQWRKDTVEEKVEDKGYCGRLREMPGICKWVFRDFRAKAALRAVFKC